MSTIRIVSVIALVTAFAAGVPSKEATDSATTTTAKKAPPRKAPPREPVVVVEEEAKKNVRAKESVEIVRQTVVKVLRILGDPSYQDSSQKKKMREQIRSILLGIVDRNDVSMLTLANYRSKFSNEQFETFSKLFSRLIFSTYIAHLETYSDEKVHIVGAETPSDSRVLVKTKTVSSTKQMPIDFSFLKQDEKWLLYDVRVEGVSLVKNYRTQFREILLNKSADQFIERVRDKVNENENKL
jgi:phospholipid transport system substrate-binding protein